MKKGNKKLLVVAGLLLLMAASLTTYALYRASVTATTTVSTASFQVTANTVNMVQEDSFSLGTLSWTHDSASGVASGKIAPGSYADITVALANNSQVSVDVTATATITDTNGDLVENMPITANVTSGGTGAIMAGGSRNAVVRVNWPINAGSDSDTAFNAQNYNVTITIEAVQSHTS